MNLLPEKTYYFLYLLINGLLQDSLITTHLTIEERITLNKLSKKLVKGSKIVEIGSYFGASSCFLANGLSQTSKLYCIDTWGNHAMLYSGDDKKDVNLIEKDTYLQFIENTKKFKNKIIKLRGWSSKMINKLKRKKIIINLLFIDGDHKYAGVKSDWKLYSPLLNRGSLVVFHDTGWAKGVKKVITDDVLKVATLLVKLPNMEVYKIK